MASMSSWDEPAPRRGGLRSVVKTTLWAAGSLGVFAAVLVFSFDLGARSPADIQDVQFALGDWREAPTEPGGREIPDQRRQVYERFDGEFAPEGALATSAAVERPTKDDREAARRAGGQSVDADAFLALVAQAVDNPDAATRRRVIDLDLQAPRAGGPGVADRPKAPPNVGIGAEPAPQRSSETDGASAESKLVTGDVGADGVGAPEIPAVETTTADTVIATADATTDVAAGGLEAPPAANDGAAIETAIGSGGDNGAQTETETEIASVEPQAQAPETEPVQAQPAQPQSAETSPVDETRATDERQIDPVLLAPQTQSGSQRPAGPKIYQIQLSALDSVAMVEDEWRKLQAAEPGLLGKYELDVQPVNVDGARLYRLRAGSFSNREQAADLCTALRDKEIDCFPASK